MRKMAIFLIASILLPLKVYANSVILTCPDAVLEKDTFVCTLSGTTSSGVYTVSARLELSEGVTLISFVPDSSWQGGGADGKIDLYTDILKTATYPIGNIKLKNNSKNDITIKLNNLIISNEKDKEITLENISKTIKIKTSENNSNNTASNNNSSNNNIKTNETVNIDSSTVTSCSLVDLKVEGYSLDFLKEITDYTLEIKNESSLKITPFLEDSEANYEIIGNENLKNGSIIKIQITSSDNKSKTYQITIKKDGNKAISNSKNNYTNILIAIIAALILINIARIIISERKKIGGVKE